MGDRRRIVVLLGAGASKDAGIPASVEMTEHVMQRIVNLTIDGRQFARAIDFIYHTLVADVAARSSEPPGFRLDALPFAQVARSEIDVERLFAAVELLIDRDKQPWSPFIAAWSPGLDAFSSGRLDEGEVNSLLNRFDSSFRAVLKLAAAGVNSDDPGRVPESSEVVPRDVTRALAGAMTEAFRRMWLRDTSDRLREVRDAMLRSLFDIVTVTDRSRVEYLRPLTRLARRQRVLTIATLNYDRTIEEISAQEKIRCDTGIESWLAGGTVKLTETGIRLLKLHGSIDWAVDLGMRRDDLPVQRFEMRDPSSPPGKTMRPAVVFGEAGKLRPEGPFLELLLTFSSELQAASALLVIGYSFRDEHVNEVIGRWFNDDRRRRIVVLDPSRFDEPSTFSSRLMSLEDKAQRAADVRVRHIKEGAATGLSKAIRAASAAAS